MGSIEFVVKRDVFRVSRNKKGTAMGDFCFRVTNAAPPATVPQEGVNVVFSSDQVFSIPPTTCVPFSSVTVFAANELRFRSPVGPVIHVPAGGTAGGASADVKLRVAAASVSYTVAFLDAETGVLRAVRPTAMACTFIPGAAFVVGSCGEVSVVWRFSKCHPDDVVHPTLFSDLKFFLYESEAPYGDMGVLERLVANDGIPHDPLIVPTQTTVVDGSKGVTYETPLTSLILPPDEVASVRVAYEPVAPPTYLVAVISGVESHVDSPDPQPMRFALQAVATCA